MVSTLKLAIVISATVRGGKAFKEAEEGSNRLAAAIKRTKTELALLAGLQITQGLAAIGRAATQSFGAFTDFSNSLVQLRAIMFDDTEGFKDLEAAARKMGQTTVFTASETADALFQLKQAGLSVSEVLEALPVSLGLARIGAIDFGTAAKIVTDIMVGMRLEASQLVDIGDAIATMAARTNTSISEMGSSFAFVSSLAAELGITLFEVAGISAALATAGIRGTTAGTSLRRVIVGLIKPSELARVQMEALGITITETADGTFDFMNVIAQFSEVLPAGLERSALAFELFGLRGGGAFLAILNAFESTDPTRNLGELITAAENSGGALELMNEAANELEGQKFKEFQNAMNSAAILIGEELAPLFMSFVRLLVDEDGDFTKGFQTFINIIKGTIDIIKAALPLLGLLTIAIGTALVVAVVHLVAAFLPFFLITTLIIASLVILIDLVDLAAKGLDKLLGTNFSKTDRAFTATSTILNPLISGSKNLLGFASGADEVRQTQLAVIHKGERIVPAFENQLGGGDSTFGSSGVMNVTNNFFLSGNATAEDQLFEQRRLEQRMRLS